MEQKTRNNNQYCYEILFSKLKVYIYNKIQHNINRFEYYYFREFFPFDKL